MSKLYLINHKYYVVASTIYWAEQEYKKYFDDYDDNAVRTIELVSESVIGVDKEC